MDAALKAIGWLNQPWGFRFATLLIAGAPFLVWATSGWLGRRRGFRWLLAWPQPLATLSTDGMELALPSMGVRRFDWDEVASLVPNRDWRRYEPPAELRGPDGSLLARIPQSLLYPKTGWRKALTLAEWVVKARPDRYVISGDNGWGRGDAFDLRDRIAAPAALRAGKRRRDLLFGALFVSTGVMLVVYVVRLLADPV